MKASNSPCQTLRRAALSSPLTRPSFQQQSIRHASLLQRPHRPYTFTQLIALSDGSTFTVRTTSPSPVHRSTQDSRNHPLWQPSLDSLRNVEKDEAGRLRAFREKYGRGWDASDGEGDAVVKADGKEGEKKGGEEAAADADESLFDLISGAAAAKKS